MFNKFSNSVFFSIWLVAIYLAPNVNAQINVTYAWSDNSVYGARIIPGKMESDRSQVTVLKLNSDGKGFSFFAELELAIGYVPKIRVLTNDGRYFIALGDIADPFSVNRTNPAFSVYDLRTRKSETFSINDVIPKTILDGRPGQWHRLKVFGQFEFDQEKKRLFITTSSTDRLLKCPTIVVDCIRMTVVAESPDFWKLKYDELKRLSQEKRRKGRALLSVEYEGLWECENETLIRPEVLHQKAGMDFLFRLIPGDGTRLATMNMMKYNADTRGFDFVKTIPLKNPVAPSRYHWPISRDAKFMMTFDEIDSMGLTKNAIVIYNLETGGSRAFGLEDFCSKEDLDNMASSKNVRMWRVFSPWITFSDPKFNALFEDKMLIEDSPGLVPHLSIDLEKMEVKLMEPFRSEYLSKRKNKMK